MGNQSSVPPSNSAPRPSTLVNNFDKSPKQQQIAQLVHFATTNYETNPTDSLLAVVQALELNNGQAAADAALQRIRAELGSEVAAHVMNRAERLKRAERLVEEMLTDEKTVLYQQGNQHLLQQAMQDGSSVVCAKCNAMIPATRWQPHQAYWCETIKTENKDNGGGETE